MVRIRHQSPSPNLGKVTLTMDCGIIRPARVLRHPVPPAPVVPPRGAGSFGTPYLISLPQNASFVCREILTVCVGKVRQMDEASLKSAIRTALPLEWRYSVQDGEFDERGDVLDAQFAHHAAAVGVDRFRGKG